VVVRANKEGVLVHRADGEAGEARGDGCFQGDAVVSGHRQQADLFAEEGVNAFWTISKLKIISLIYYWFYKIDSHTILILYNKIGYTTIQLQDN